MYKYLITIHCHVVAVAHEINLPKEYVDSTLLKPIRKKLSFEVRTGMEKDSTSFYRSLKLARSCSFGIGR